MNITQPRRGGQKRAFLPDEVKTLERFLTQSLDPRRCVFEYALLRTALDTMLRGSDLLKLQIGDVVWHEAIVDRIALTQQKTRTSHVVTLMPKTREALANWLSPISEQHLGCPLFNLGIRQYQRTVKRWAEMLQLDPRFYSSHSLRRTKAKLIYERTKNIEVVRELLGQTSIDSTRYYLGVEQADAHKVAWETEI